MKYTFKGGIHPDTCKVTADSRVRLFADPKTVHIPMRQHIGAPCIPLVRKGDHVLAGQKIGEVPEGALGAPVHSSVSGTVLKVEKVIDARGDTIEQVVIENDFQNTVSPEVKSFPKKLSDSAAHEIIQVVKEAGIVGMGGAGFPAHAKIASSVAKATTIIINCVECEPYLTANYRLMIERPQEMVNGAKILMKALGIHNVIFAIEDNKPIAIRKMQRLTAGNDMMRVAVMKTKYPQGDERRIIDALTGQELGRGKLPSDLGCVIFNAETVSAIYTAFAKGLPSIYRIVTVSGDCVANPSNVLVPIGTTVRDLVDFCGGLILPPHKIVNGGPMMGNSLWTENSPVTKTTSGIILLPVEQVDEESPETECIRCGRCVRACPSRLMPCNIANSVKVGDMADAELYGAVDCVECGSCSFVCPAKIPLVQYIRIAKGEIRKQSKK